FKGYIPSFMAFSQLPDTFNGAIWLRITLDASFEKPVTALRIDLGSSLPGVTRLFVPRANGGFTVLENPPHLGMFTLPENVPFPDVLYARIDGTPGLWFKPFLGPAEEAPRALPVHFLLAGLFGAAMLLLLFRYVRKAEEWRLWAAITAGCGIVTAILPPVPIAGAAYTPLMATALLIPGLILVLYAHTTRHLFNSPTAIPGYDKILVGLYLAGGVIALLPLVPGFLWTSRYLPFAGALLVALLPLCMIALALSLRGCSAYFCACLLPVFGVAASAWELTATGAPMLAGTGGLWGFGLAVLVLAFIPPARATAEETAEDDVFDSLCRSSPLTLRDAGPFEPEPPREPGEPARPVEPVFTETAPDSPEGPTDETAQREEIPDEGPLADEYPSLSLFDGETRITEPSPATEIQAADNAASAALPIPESALSPRPALASSIEEGIPLETASPAGAEPASRPQTLPERNFSAAPDAPPAPIVPATPEASSPPVLTLTDTEPEETAGASALSWSVEKHVPREDNEPSEQEEPDPAPAMERRKSRRILFNLPLLIKNAYDTLAPLAEGKNCSMTWYIAPQTGRLFEGDAELLESALRRILRDMVESVEQGNVRLTVRRLPDSAEAGHLVFTIAGWDAKQVTAHERNIAGHAEAWALAEKTGGIFSVEHSPSGTTVIFSAMFTAMDTPRPAEAEASGAVPCPANEAGRIAVPGRENSVVASVFTDHPDIAPPVESEENLTVRSVIADIPVGVDADGLAEERETERSPYRLIIADIAVSSRARAAGQFADSPYSVLECASPADAFALYRRHPSALVIMNADMPEVDILEAINDIHADDAEHGRTPAFSVALAGYPAQANRLAQAGVTRTVLKKQMEEELLPTVEELLPPPGPRQPQAAPAKASAPEIRLGNALDDVPPVPATFAPGEPVTGLSAPSELPPSILSPVAGDASAMPENGPAAHATEPEKTPPARLEVPAGPVVPGAGYSGPGLG
ncbi:MAG: hypothetical protein LIP28_09355, partial [Deltaproteobacteria bacterium]|nr:hypothetical protein [Deltaproteobacteria bacterium]